ncbi:MAG: NADH:flavin oxidoreductase [Candidatus Omnitrophota bacterium]
MAAAPHYPRVSRYKTAEAFRTHLQELSIELPLDEKILTAAEGSPLAQPIEIFGRLIGNRWCIHPMEGWDGESNGMPSEHTLRRWRRFGESGAKVIFGGEASAVCHQGRSNPYQLLAVPANKNGFAALLNVLKQQHKQLYGTADDLLIGLQLTHSGRFSKPNSSDRPEPRILFHHPILDKRVGVAPHDDSAIMTDGEIEELIERYADAAKMAYDAGFDFVDLKHCHGYLGHEFLSAHTREGQYGGAFANRTRFLRNLAQRIRAEVPGLHLAVRLSAFDLIPFRPAQDGVGVPEPYEHLLPYRYGFGVDVLNPLQYDLSETFQFLSEMEELGIELANITGGSPYYNPHIQRPALFPPSDGYEPPEDPLTGAARLIQVARIIKAKFPRMKIIGTGYTYLQEFLPHAAQAAVREGWTDMVGIGRMALIYPNLPADCLTRGAVDSKRLCRTFSDCTTAPRHGMISGCYPLDEYYKTMPEAARVKAIKKK